MFNAPIPGQSLTTPPGGRPWEKPARVTDPDKAMAQIVKGVTSPKGAKGLLNFMEMGVPVEGLAQTLLLSYVMKGEFSVDVAMLLMEPTTALLAQMALQVGIQPVLSEENDDADMLELVKNKSRTGMSYIPGAGMTPEIEEDEEMEPTGLMSLGG